MFQIKLHVTLQYQKLPKKGQISTKVTWNFTWNSLKVTWNFIQGFTVLNKTSNKKIKTRKNNQFTF